MVKFNKTYRLRGGFTPLNLTKGDIKVDIVSLREEAEDGNAESQCLLGRIYLGLIDLKAENIEIEPNPIDGIFWLNKSAEKGNQDAIYCLAMCYLHGLRGTLPPRTSWVSFTRKAKASIRTGTKPSNGIPSRRNTVLQKLRSTLQTAIFTV